MNLTTVVVGAAAILYGIHALGARATNPKQFGKLEAMKKQWGSTAGIVVHIVAYSIVPIVVGVIFLLTGLQGRSLF